MPHKPRLNRLIELLEQEKPAFGTHVSNGNLDEIANAATAAYDFVFIENEHVGMDFSQLRVSLQFFLNRKNILEQGSLQANPTPLVRVAPNTGEMNQWVLKQTLDHGVYGVLLPKVESVEAAKAAVLACRYPQKRGAEHSWGERGWSPGAASRYWGLTVPEYYEAAGLWPLDPDGEIFLMAICESARGVQNLPDILREVQGIGGVLAGPGDLSVTMGAAGNPQDPDVQEALLSILNTCKQFGVPCGAVASTPDELDRQMEQGYQFFITSSQPQNPTLQHALSITDR